MRCRGAKEMYKIGGGYSAQNMGGVKVKCPMCMGAGEIDKLETAKKKRKPAARKKPAVKAVPAVHVENLDDAVADAIKG
jgi:hypothetical protein